MATRFGTLESRFAVLEKEIKTAPAPTMAKPLPATKITEPPQTTQLASKSVIKPKRKLNLHNPTLPAHHTRLVVQVQPNGLVDPKSRPDDFELITGINQILGKHEDSKGMRVVSVKWNDKGNAILFTREDQKASDLEKFADRFTHLIAPSTRANADVRFYKIQINTVRTGVFNRLPGSEPTVFTSEELLKELLDNNPVLANMKLTQEPGWMRPAEEIRNQGYSSIRLSFANEDDANFLVTQLKVVALFGKNCDKIRDFEVTLRSDLIQDRDIQILDIRQPGHPTKTIVHLYNDPRLARRGMAWRLREINLPTENEIILSGDWNIHHELWSAGRAPTKAVTTEIIDWLEAKGYSLMNQKGEITYIPHDKKKKPSVIDLTWVNQKALAANTAKEWCIDRTLAYSSDHYEIRWVIDDGAVPIENILSLKYVLSDTDPEKWKEAYSAELGLIADKLILLRDRDSVITPSQMDEIVEAITTAMLNATDKTTPRKRPSPNPTANQWWDDELDRAADNITILREEQHDFVSENGGEQCPRLQSLIKKSRNFAK
ncbi:hypothetical protein C8J56DRAFT_788121 [Mycena floridula]|nr:hypothetical protein C8J56DRAFT_788121 [Mycena floridula]